jgi:hypothetical protein
MADESPADQAASPLSPIMKGLTNEDLMNIADNGNTFNQFYASARANEATTGDRLSSGGQTPVRPKVIPFSPQCGSPVVKVKHKNEPMEERRLRRYLQVLIVFHLSLISDIFSVK